MCIVRPATFTKERGMWILARIPIGWNNSNINKGWEESHPPRVECNLLVCSPAPWKHLIWTPANAKKKDTTANDVVMASDCAVLYWLSFTPLLIPLSSTSDYKPPLEGEGGLQALMFPSLHLSPDGQTKCVQIDYIYIILKDVLNVGWILVNWGSFCAIYQLNFTI
jgi:hypothetical protein